MVQVRQSEARLLVNQATDQKQRRRARWSRNPEDLRVAHVVELEKQLNDSAVLEDDGDDEPDGGSDTWRERAPTVAEDEPRDICGFLVKKTGALSGQKRRFFVLSGGTLLWYKSEKDKSPTGYVHLAETIAITEHNPSMLGAPSRIPDAESGCVFVIKATKEYILWADDEVERDKWLRSLRHNRAFPPVRALTGASSARQRSECPTDAAMASAAAARKGSTEAPGGAVPLRATYPAAGAAGAGAAGVGEPKAVAKAAKRSMLGNLALKCEKKMVGRAVTSDLGKKLLREYCLPETFMLLQALRELASVDPTMPPKAGQKIEDTILRTAVKVVLINQHGRLGAADFGLIILLVDDLCVDVVRKYDATREPPYADEEDPSHRGISSQIKRLDVAIGQLLEGHISAKNLGALSDVLAYLGAPENMRRFLSEPKCCMALTRIAEALRSIYGL